MANEKNLMPIEYVNSRRTREEHSRDSQKAGKKSGEVRRQRKAFREQMELLLSLPVKNKEQKAFMEQLGIDEDNMDNQMMLLMSVFNKAMKGDLEAFREIKGVVSDMGKNASSDRVMIVDDLDGDDTD